MSGRSPVRQTGLSLIELMIAMVIGLVLMLGLLRIFSASREASRMSEGIGRVQENARFALDYIQGDLRMVGHLGCVNDQARLISRTGGSSESIPTTFNTSASGSPMLDFDKGLKGFGALNTAPGNTLTIPADPVAGGWVGSPNPAAASADGVLLGKLAGRPPVKGSDILALRYFSATGVPVQNITYMGDEEATINVDKARWDQVMRTGGYSADASLGLLGIADCINAATFQATTAPNASGTFTVLGSKGLNTKLNGGIAVSTGQTMLYRLETEVLYVGINDQGTPALYRARFVAAPGGSTVNLLGGAPEEIVSGIENMQILYGVDHQTDVSKLPDGYVTAQQTASAVAEWQRVSMVQVALLSRSQERASANDQPESRTMLGTSLTLPSDGRLRSVYETTITLRNRMYGN